MAEPNARAADAIGARTDRSNDGTIDHGNSVSSNTPVNQGPVRLGVVSKIAAARLAEDRHAGDGPIAETIAEEASTARATVRHLRSSRPRPHEFGPGQLKRATLPLAADFGRMQPVRARRSWMGPAVLSVMLLSVLGIALVEMEELPLPAFWDRQASDRAASFTWLSSQTAKEGPAQRSESSMPRLLVQAARGTTGEPLQLSMSLQGDADGAFVMITGLIPGMTLSTGTAVGADGWRVPATDLADIWIGPPTQFVGTVDLMVELHLPDQRIAARQRIHLEWAAATSVLASANPPMSTQPPAVPSAPREPGTDPVVASASPSVLVERPAVRSSQAILDQVVTSGNSARTAPVVAVSPPGMTVPAPPQFDRKEIAILIERGKELIASGDLAAARLVLLRAAESQDAEAALMLGSTYDPMVVRELKVYGLASDVAMARIWYEKAKELGSLEASRRLETQAGGDRSPNQTIMGGATR